MGPYKVALNQVLAVPAGVLRVISYVILTYTRTFSNQEPIPFSKTHALSYTHSKVRNDQMHIRGEMTSGKWTTSGFLKSPPESLWWFEGGIESSFSGTSWGAKGHFRWIFLPQPMYFRRGPSPFSLSTSPQKVWGWSDIYSRRMGPWKVALNQVPVVPAGVLRVSSDGFWTPTHAF